MEPTSEQVLLLKAALLAGGDAIEAWQAWRSRTSIDTLDGDSQWLLPLLYHNLHALGVPGPAIVRYRNVYLHNWYKNSLTLRRAEPLVRHLEQTRGPVVLLGGGAMALRYYGTVGARPFGPLRVLAHETDGRAQDPARSGHADVEVQATLFGQRLDGRAIARSCPVRWTTMKWHVLDPADQLVEICVRRQAWDQRSRLFWLADAAILLRSTPRLEWDDVMSLAEQAGVRDVLENLVAYLTNVIGLTIPQTERPPLHAVHEAAR